MARYRRRMGQREAKAVGAIGCMVVLMMCSGFCGGLFSPEPLSVTSDGTGSIGTAELPSIPSSDGPASPPVVNFTAAPAIQPAQQETVDKLTGDPIPGLAVSDVYNNLALVGFERSGPAEDGSAFVTVCHRRDGRGVQLNAVVRGSTYETAQSIVATSMTPYGNPNLTTKDYFGFLATMPYDGAMPDAAKTWVMQNVGRPSAREFGGVIYILENGPDPQSRTLRICTLAVAMENGRLAQFPELLRQLPAEAPLPADTDAVSPAPRPTETSTTPRRTEITTRPSVETERKAASRLRLAQSPKNPVTRKKWLQEVVDEFPGTAAAAEAARELQDE